MAIALKSKVAEWYNDPVSKDKFAGKYKIKNIINLKTY